MTGLAAAMKALERLGTAQNRKVYARHGVGPKLYGVSYANLGKLVKRIGVDHELALRLWASANHDARVLATLVANPARMTPGEIERWCRDLDNYVLTDAFVKLVAKTSHATAKIESWTLGRGEWLGRAGWLLLARRAMDRREATPDRIFEDRIEQIESRIRTSPNRVRDAMNSALIAIGLRNPSLQRRALAAARRIGKVEVNHGKTGCKTPDAAAYIERARAKVSTGRRSRRARG